MIFIPQGEFVAFGALTLAMLQAGKVPATVWLLVAMGAIVAVVDGLAACATGTRKASAACSAGTWPIRWRWRRCSHAVEPGGLPMALQILLTLAILVPLGPMIYRIAYQPIAETSVLVLLIASVAVHLIPHRAGAGVLRRRGAHAPFSEGSLNFGEVSINLQTFVGGGLLAGLHRRAGGLLHAQPVRQRRCGPPR